MKSTTVALDTTQQGRLVRCDTCEVQGVVCLAVVLTVPTGWKFDMHDSPASGWSCASPLSLCRGSNSLILRSVVCLQMHQLTCYHRQHQKGYFSRTLYVSILLSVLFVCLLAHCTDILVIHIVSLFAGYVHICYAGCAG